MSVVLGEAVPEGGYLEILEQNLAHHRPSLDRGGGIRSQCLRAWTECLMDPDLVLMTRLRHSGLLVESFETAVVIDRVRWSCGDWLTRIALHNS